MQVTVLYGQKHKGNTYKITQMLINKFNCNKEDINEFYVNGMPQCVGCYNCILKDEKLCPHREITEPIIKSIEASNVIVLVSPNYCFGMTGQLKSFCDHMAYRWVVHRPFDMRNKIGISICTTAGSGAKTVVKELSRQMNWWSVGKCYNLPFVVMAESFDEIKEKRIKKLERKTSKLANKVNKKAGKIKPCIKTKVLFFVMKKMHTGASWNELEKEYWQENLLNE